MPLSFHEKSLWITFVGLLMAAGLYGATALPGASSTVESGQIGLFAVAVGVLVVSQIVGHAVAAAVDRHHQTDERDRIIALQGSRNGAVVLAGAVSVALVVAVLIPGNFLFTHVLLAGWVLAQLVDTGSQLVSQRSGH